MTGNPVTLGAAIAGAASVYARLCAGQDGLAARGGPEAVAAAACPNGTDEDRAAIAAHYKRLTAETSRGREPAA